MDHLLQGAQRGRRPTGRQHPLVAPAVPAIRKAAHTSDARACACTAAHGCALQPTASCSASAQRQQETVECVQRDVAVRRCNPAPPPPHTHTHDIRLTAVRLCIHISPLPHTLTHPPTSVSQLSVSASAPSPPHTHTPRSISQLCASAPYFASPPPNTHSHAPIPASHCFGMHVLRRHSFLQSLLQLRLDRLLLRSAPSEVMSALPNVTHVYVQVGRRIRHTCNRRPPPDQFTNKITTLYRHT
eukprot:281132-Chlamydomonas_euryale.AAC.2